MVALIKNKRKKHKQENMTVNKIQAIYTTVNIRLLQPTKLIGRSKFIIEFMASLHPQFTGQFETEVCLTFNNELNISWFKQLHNGELPGDL